MLYKEFNAGSFESGSVIPAPEIEAYRLPNNLDLMDQRGITASELSADLELDLAYQEETHEDTDLEPYADFFEGFSVVAKSLRKAAAKKLPREEAPDQTIDAMRLTMSYIAREQSRPNHRLALEDRFQSAALRVLGRLSQYDPDRSSLSSFTFAIASQGVSLTEKGYLKELSQADVVRVPSSRPGYYIVRNRLEALSAKFRRNIDLEEAIQMLGQSAFKPDHLVDYLDSYRQFVSIETLEPGELDEAIGYEGEDPTFAQLSQDLLGAGASWVLGLLGEERADVLIIRFGLDGDEPLSYRRTAQCLGRSHETIRKIEKEALAILAETPKIKAMIKKETV